MALQLISKKRNYTLSEDDNPLGVLSFPKWYSHNAEIELNRKKYEIRKKSMWSSTYFIRHQGFQIGQIKMDWKGGVSIVIENKNRRPQKLYVQHKGFLKSKFHLADEQKKPMTTFKAIHSWTKMKSDFEIEKQTEIEHLDTNLTYLLGAFCIVLHQAHVAAAGAGVG